MESQKVRISATVEINQALEDSLYNWLMNLAAGRNRDDAKIYEEAAESVRSGKLNKAARIELCNYLLYRAGFDQVHGKNDRSQVDKFGNKKMKKIINFCTRENLKNLNEKAIVKFDSLPGRKTKEDKELVDQFRAGEVSEVNNCGIRLFFLLSINKGKRPLVSAVPYCDDQPEPDRYELEDGWIFIKNSNGSIIFANDDCENRNFSEIIKIASDFGFSVSKLDLCKQADSVAVCSKFESNFDGFTVFSPIRDNGLIFMFNRSN